jgi:hypothetical protein
MWRDVFVAPASRRRFSPKVTDQLHSKPKAAGETPAPHSDSKFRIRDRKDSQF